MNEFYHDFMKHLQVENRENSLNFALSMLMNRKVDIITLYDQILTPSLNNMTPGENDMSAIWSEHVRSSIIRTIIENCYPYVINERDERYKFQPNKKVAVVCPSEEYHEIGARMVTDFFTLLGYHATFVGSNTPKDQFIKALDVIHFDYIAFSISNQYNLITARKTIEEIKATHPKVKVIVGGSAFKHTKADYKTLKADMYIETFEDIKKLAEEDTV